MAENFSASVRLIANEERGLGRTACAVGAFRLTLRVVEAQRRPPSDVQPERTRFHRYEVNCHVCRPPLPGNDLAGCVRAAGPDADGYIWYTGNSNATIGKLDPKTGAITEYKTKGRDPHTAIFHPNGKLYFTSQGAAMIGRLDPKTGELTEIDTEPRPYGIQVAQDGTLLVAYNGTNKLGALNPETMEVKYFAVPDERSRIRRRG